MQLTASVKNANLEQLNKAIAKLAFTASKYAAVRIGIFEEATNEKTGEKVAFYAACNEFGTRTIPARAFMRITIEKNADKWLGIFKKALRGVSIVEHPEVLKTAFARVGIVGRNDMQETILSNVPPPNSKATQRAKMKRATGANPQNAGQTATGYWGTLYDTGSMYKSIRHRIVDSDGNYVEEGKTK